ncbi:MAG: DUF4129 domain-containing protein [Nitrospira sp.]|nr:DUF4129 domain-containing protein [Nitrospira sp.]
MKSASATPMEVLRHVRDEWAEAWPSADALTQLYTRVRFGHAPSLPKTIPLPKTCCAGSTHWNERQLVHNNSPD